MAKLTCRVRKYRKSIRLSQRELAILIGLKSQGSFSEVEAGLKQPSAAVAFACAIVLDVSAPELFPGLHTRSERAVLANLQKLRKTASQNQQGATANPVLMALASRLSAKNGL